MQCPGCHVGTMSETRPYVWKCSFCGNTVFRPWEDSSYASSRDTSTSSGYTNSYDIGSSLYDTSSNYTNPYDTGSYGTGSYSGSSDGSDVDNRIMAAILVIGGIYVSAKYGSTGLQAWIMVIGILWIALWASYKRKARKRRKEEEKIKSGIEELDRIQRELQNSMIQAAAAVRARENGIKPNQSSAKSGQSSVKPKKSSVKPKKKGIGFKVIIAVIIILWLIGKMCS